MHVPIFPILFCIIICQNIPHGHADRRISWCSGHACSFGSRISIYRSRPNSFSNVILASSYMGSAAVYAHNDPTARFTREIFQPADPISASISRYVRSFALNIPIICIWMSPQRTGQRTIASRRDMAEVDRDAPRHRERNHSSLRVRGLEGAGSRQGQASAPRPQNRPWSCCPRQYTRTPGDCQQGGVWCEGLLLVEGA